MVWMVVSAVRVGTALTHMKGTINLNVGLGILGVFLKFS